jgi:alpha-glucosidase
MAVCANAVNLQSPDGNYVITLNGMTYSVDFKGHPIVRQSLLGVNVDNRLFESALAIPRGSHENWCDDLELKGIEHMSVDTQWSPLYGENVSIRDCYNELVLHFEKGSEGQGTVSEGYDKRQYYAMDIIVRAYNEGVAFRYHFPETANGLFLHITGEQTSFAFPDGTLAWYEEWAQGPYEKRLLKGTWFESERPLLLQLPTGEYVALLEASLKDYTRGKFKLKKDNELQIAMYDCADVISPYDTPWRVMMVGERAVDLINNKDLVLNLNAERAAGDWSWVKPGKAFRAGQLSKKGIMSAIDFCSQFGFDYVELDAGWYGPEGQVASDATKVSDSRDFTMPEICAYAKSKGIGVWVYVNQRALYYQLDKLLPLYQQWGISGIKFGFVQIGNQQWTTWLHHAVAQCAAYRLMVDIHDEYRPTGLSRTYPHLLTQEGVCGNEEMPDATHNTLLPFTRYLCGPADYTLCYFNSRVKNTKGHQLAMAAVYYSPLQFYFWYDSPFVDQGESELQFWKDCPTVFDESVALDGIPGEYIIQARRSGHDWFVGAMTNTEGRTIQVPTDFLPKGKYIVEIFNDDPALNTRTKVSSQSIIIKAGKIISLELQPSGGATLHFKPMSK